MSPSATDRQGTVTRITQAPRLRASATPPSQLEPQPPTENLEDTLDHVSAQRGDANRDHTQVHKHVAARLTVPAAELLRSRETEDPYIDALLENPPASPAKEQRDDPDTDETPSDEPDEPDELDEAFAALPPDEQDPATESPSAEEPPATVEEPLSNEHPLAAEESLANDALIAADPADTPEQERDDFFDGLARSAPSLPNTQPAAVGSAGLDADSAVRPSKPRPAPKPARAPAREDNVVYLPSRRRIASPAIRGGFVALVLIAVLTIVIAAVAAIGGSASHHPAIAASNRRPTITPVHSTRPTPARTVKHTIKRRHRTRISTPPPTNTTVNPAVAVAAAAPRPPSVPSYHPSPTVQQPSVPSYTPPAAEPSAPSSPPPSTPAPPTPKPRVYGQGGLLGPGHMGR